MLVLCSLFPLLLDLMAETFNGRCPQYHCWGRSRCCCCCCCSVRRMGCAEEGAGALYLEALRDQRSLNKRRRAGASAGAHTYTHSALSVLDMCIDCLPLLLASAMANGGASADWWMQRRVAQCMSADRLGEEKGTERRQSASGNWESAQFAVNVQLRCGLLACIRQWKQHSHSSLPLRSLAIDRQTDRLGVFHALSSPPGQRRPKE